MPFYDRPFFKQLRKNDLGIDTHQGGVFIPKLLLPFLPPLPAPTKGPTEEYFLTLDLFDGALPVATVTARWHYQTWHQTRTPEHRLTQQIESALLATANVDDILVFERQSDVVDRYRVTLVRGGTARHGSLLTASHGERWGFEAEPPNRLTAILTEIDHIRREQEGPFQLFAERVLGDPHRRLLRDAAFARLVKRAYGHRCAACGVGWLVPVGDPGPDPTSEPEAAHVVPVALRGRDDLRNGLCLCRAHHWAFDKRLIFVDETRTWRVILASEKENRNALLNDLAGSPLIPPRDGYALPDPSALNWHRQQVLIQ